MKVNYRSTGKRADSGTTVLVLACAPLHLFRETADLCNTNTSQIGPKYLRTPNHFDRMIPLRAIHLVDTYSFVLLNFQRDCLPHTLPYETESTLIYCSAERGPSFSLLRSPGTWKFTAFRSQSIEYRTSACDVWLTGIGYGAASTERAIPPRWGGKGNEAIFLLTYVAPTRLQSVSKKTRINACIAIACTIPGGGLGTCCMVLHHAAIAVAFQRNMV
jgi:hypothetical protein